MFAGCFHGFVIGGVFDFILDYKEHFHQPHREPVPEDIFYHFSIIRYL